MPHRISHWEYSKVLFRGQTKYPELNRYLTLREKCTNTEFFLVRIFPNSD